jgi:hypothetical protein
MPQSHVCTDGKFLFLYHFFGVVRRVQIVGLGSERWSGYTDINRREVGGLTAR